MTRHLTCAPACAPACASAPTGRVPQPRPTRRRAPGRAGAPGVDSSHDISRTDGCALRILRLTGSSTSSRGSACAPPPARRSRRRPDRRRSRTRTCTPGAHGRRRRRHRRHPRQRARPSRATSSSPCGASACTARPTPAPPSTPGRSPSSPTRRAPSSRPRPACRCCSRTTPGALLGDVAAWMYGHPARELVARRRHRHQRQDHHHLLRRRRAAHGARQPPPCSGRSSCASASAPSRARARRSRRPRCTRCCGSPARRAPARSPWRCPATPWPWAGSHGTDVRRRRVHQPPARPPRLPRRHGRVLRRQGAAVRARPGRARRRRGRRRLGSPARRPRPRSRWRPSRRTSASPEGETADWAVVEATIGLDGVGSTFTLRGPDGARHAAASPLPGLVNVSNAALAIVLAHRAGVPLPDAVAAVGAAHAIPGRMERVIERGDGRPLALVDYAHTPDALVLALEAVRPITPGRLVLVLGSDGDRDQGKRPIMGEIGARLADVLVVTDENPRSEDPAAIRAQILAGALGGASGRHRHPRGDLARRGHPGGPRPRRRQGHDHHHRQGARAHPGDRRGVPPVQRPRRAARGRVAAPPAAAAGRPTTSLAAE